MQLTYRYRIKDKHAKRLNCQARAVNFVWNYCNETGFVLLGHPRALVHQLPSRGL
jgi:hypothetical protein